MTQEYIQSFVTGHVLEKLLENILIVLAISRASMHAQKVIYKDILQMNQAAFGSKSYNTHFKHLKINPKYSLKTKGKKC